MTKLTTLKTGLIALAVAFAGITGVHAQAAAGKQSIAVFDTQKVMNGTNAAKRANDDFTAKRRAAQQKVNDLEKPLMDKKQKLIAQQGVMAADKFQAASADFAKEVDAFRMQAQKITSDLEDQIMQTRKKIADAVGTSVEQLAKEKSYDLVLPRSMVLFSGPNVPDISNEILARANKILDAGK
jgi:outer membrane protein